MKRILLTAFVALVLLSVIISYQAESAARRIVEYSGTFVDTMVNSDTDTKISDRYQLARTAVGGDLSFDEILLGFYIPNMDSIAASGDVNAVDSAIIRVIGGSGTNTDTILSVTKASLPATFTMSYSADSVGINRQKLLYDHIWFSAYVVDSAGSGAGDSLRYTITWWMKLIERRGQ